MMNNFLMTLWLPLVLLAGCSQEGVQAPLELSAFIEELKEEQEECPDKNLRFRSVSVIEATFQ